MMDASEAATLTVQRMVDLIERCFAERMTLQTVSSALKARPERLRWMFRKVTGTSVHQYLTRVRLEHAAHHIRSGDKIDSVAVAVGYQSKKNFYRQFRRNFGVTPVGYRRRQSNGYGTGSGANGKGRNGMTTYIATFAGIVCRIDVESRPSLKGRSVCVATPFVQMDHGVQPFAGPANVEMAGETEAEALERAAVFLEHRFGRRSASPLRYKNGVRKILAARP